MSPGNTLKGKSHGPRGRFPVSQIGAIFCSRSLSLGADKTPCFTCYPLAETPKTPRAHDSVAPVRASFVGTSSPHCNPVPLQGSCRVREDPPSALGGRPRCLLVVPENSETTLQRLFCPIGPQDVPFRPQAFSRCEKRRCLYLLLVFHR